MVGHQPYRIDLDEPFRVLLVEPSLDVHAEPESVVYEFSELG